MESIKPDSTLPNESVSHPSFNQMNQKDVFQVPKNPVDDLPWIVDGLAFPKGTEFRGKYKGYFYYGKVTSGALMMNGKEFLSPSAAAMHRCSLRHSRNILCTYREIQCPLQRQGHRRSKAGKNRV